MRIAYVTFEKPQAKSGVGKKISSQVVAWREAGHQVKNVVIGIPEGGTLLECDYAVYPALLKPYFGACFATFRLHKILKEYRPDIIYARQLLWWPGSVWVLSVAPVVFEINSLSSEEYRLVSMPKFLFHAVTGKRLLGIAGGLVSVTGEIDRSLPCIPARRCVIGNGYDFDPRIVRIPPKNNRPTLVFVASSCQPWQGIDKVLRLASLLPEFDFHVVAPDFRCAAPGNVVCHGVLLGAELEEVFRSTDVAIGTLALHRKQMQEASPLKTREYLAYGIPVIAGYRDIDLEDADYFLDIGNFEGNVELAIPRIREFVDTWIGKPVPYDDVKLRLESSRKEKRRIEFFKEVLCAEAEKNSTDNQ